MKVKRILSLILSLTLMLTGCISVSLAEEPEAEEPLESDNELSVIMEEEIEIVRLALDKLAKEDRSFIVKIFYDGRSHKELVPEYGATIDAIRYRKKNVLKELKKILRDRGLEE